MSTKNISSKLNENCKIVWIPNTYFNGYFPNYKFQYRHIGPANTQGFFTRGDRYVEKIMDSAEMNPDVEKILDKISAIDFIDTKTIKNGTEESFAELRKREWFCDVKISDYVENNVFGKRIFFTQNHPNQQVLMEVARRILRAIGIYSDNFFDYNELLDDSNFNFSLIGMDAPIYPSTLRFFEIEDYSIKFWANRHLWDFHANFRDFQREYIKKLWAEKFSK